MLWFIRVSNLVATNLRFFKDKNIYPVRIVLQGKEVPAVWLRPSLSIAPAGWEASEGGRKINQLSCKLR